MLNANQGYQTYSSTLSDGGQVSIVILRRQNKAGKTSTLPCGILYSFVMRKMIYPLKYLPCFLVMVLLLSCNSSRKTASSKEEQQTLPELPLSELDIPIRLAAAPIITKAEHLVPTEFTSDAWPQFMQPSCDFRYKYRFVRTALQISCNNNLFNIR